jgi:hypothetical protein
MKKATMFCVLFVLSGSSHAVDCGVDLSFGKITLGGISSAHGDEILTTKYTRVESQIKNTSKVTELAFECEWKGGYAVSLSHLSGVQASITRNVYFTGYQGHGINIPEGYLLTVNEEVRASANRLSALKYFDYGSISPYLRLGIEDVRATHRVWVNIEGLTLGKEETKKKAAPYVGFGVAFFRKGPFVARLEAQVMALDPHKIQMYTIGIHGQF